MHSLRDTNPAAFAQYLRAKNAEPCANERLAAAAPDLLAMLVKLTRAIERLPAASPLDGLAEDARAIIARATGAA